MNVPIVSLSDQDGFSPAVQECYGLGEIETAALFERAGRLLCNQDIAPNAAAAVVMLDCGYGRIFAEALKAHLRAGEVVDADTLTGAMELALKAEPAAWKKAFQRTLK